MENTTRIASPPYSGRFIKTPWSDHVVVLDVLYSVKVAESVFHGVRAVNTDLQWDWPDIIHFLWVLEPDNDDDLKLAPEWDQPPRMMDHELPCGIELVIGDYQSTAGNTYLAVKWRDYDCPTWELEDDVIAWECMGIRRDRDTPTGSGIVTLRAPSGSLPKELLPRQSSALCTKSSKPVH